MQIVKINKQIIRINKVNGCGWMVYADVSSVGTVAAQPFLFHTKKDAIAFIEKGV